MKKLLLSLLSLSLSFSLIPALAMEPAQLKYTQNELDRELIKALAQGNIAHAKALIQAGADVNAQCISNPIVSLSCPLLAALGQDNTECIRLLLDEGADIRIGGFSIGGHNRALMAATIWGSAPEIRKERISLLITCSRFFDRACQQELQNAQRRTRARISVLNTIRPALPNDVKRLILASNPFVWLDACSTPLRLHTNQHTYCTKMPLEVLRTLIHNNALDLEKTIAFLSNYKMEKLRPLMLEAAPLAGGPRAHNDGVLRVLNPVEGKEILPLLNPDLLEQNYGEAIRGHMRDCLIPAENTGWIESCSIQ